MKLLEQQSLLYDSECWCLRIGDEWRILTAEMNLVNWTSEDIG